MRNRLEDLGKICILLENLMEKELFKAFDCRSKDSIEYFRNLPPEVQDELIRSLAYGIENVQSDLYRIQEIAEGTTPTDDCHFGYWHCVDPAK